MTTNTTIPQSRSLSEKITAARARKVESMPASIKGLASRVYAGKASPRACLKLFCYDCVGFERKAISECASYSCPLWNSRPFQTPESEEARKEAMAKFSLN